MTNVHERVASFINWPYEHVVSSASLVEAGFYYTHRLDIVQCKFCALRLYRWEAGSVPMMCHEQSRPHCPFILSLKEPARVSPSCSSSAEADQSVQNMPKTDNILTTPGPSWLNNDRVIAGEEPGLITCPKSCAYKEYELLTSREKTYIGWPNHCPCVEQMATAGFYYTGQRDCVRCFFCGLGLQQWQESDIPIEEHLKYKSDCAYAVLNRPMMNQFQEEHLNSSVSGLQLNENRTDADTKQDLNEAAVNLKPAQVSNVEHDDPAVTGLGKSSSCAQFQYIATDRKDSYGNTPTSGCAIKLDKSQVKNRKVSLPSMPRSNKASSVGSSQVLLAELSSTFLSPANSLANSEQSDSSGYCLSLTNDYPPKALVLPVDAQVVADFDPYEDNLYTLGQKYEQLKEKCHDLCAQNTTLKKLNAELREKNRKLMEERLCNVCMEKERCIVVIPCGHFISCATCVFSCRECPICRADVKSVMRAYSS